uniref:G_PROTEIN_RECEP_F2_4 domain-containing protein n=1 Tax=Macrostomum lignano TaxID=282301 RepID=A0A1I8JMD4_9PLAT
SAVCRFNQALVTYSVLGSSAWVSIEALHLYMLIFVNTMSTSKLSTPELHGHRMGSMPACSFELFARAVREDQVSAPIQRRVPRATGKCGSLLLCCSGVWIYYIIFLPMSVMPKDRLGATLDCIKLFYEHFFNSFQGFFVSLLLCFVNSEAQREQKRLLLQTLPRRPGRWLKARGILKPPADAFGLELENRRNNRRARRGAEN